MRDEARWRGREKYPNKYTTWSDAAMAAPSGGRAGMGSWHVSLLTVDAGGPYAGMPVVNTAVRPAHVVSLVRSGLLSSPKGCVKEHANCGPGTGTRGGSLITLMSVPEEPTTTDDYVTFGASIHRRAMPTAGPLSVHVGVPRGLRPVE